VSASAGIPVTADRERPIAIAVLAMGGQGGGVLTDWIVAAAEEAGWAAQSTSVPGVAQRTGATIYYIETLPPRDGRIPVLSLTPTPGDVDVVLAGGVNAMITPLVTIGFDEVGGVLAPDGRIKSFSSDADGYSRSEGGGMLVLKRVADARRDGDQIIAVIAGSAVNHDGRSNGLLAPNPDAPVTLVLAEGPVDEQDVFLAHKTTWREAYAPHRAHAAALGVDDALLWNTRGEVTETTIGSVALRDDDGWWTPPVSCGLLPGVERELALADGRVRERVLTVPQVREALARGGELWFLNSVRGWRRATLLPG
jgi:hypothetical protein